MTRRSWYSELTKRCSVDRQEWYQEIMLKWQMVEQMGDELQLNEDSE
jgi:hypothetical protein